MTQVSFGMSHLHRAMIMHRDLKPSNVFLDKYGTIKVRATPSPRVPGRCAPVAVMRTTE